ncbi:MAG: tRNA lysidine(34) synthetase TilS [Rickettsiales bacterium]|jgi:tRNA(Ile)-lysidine synthase|nr:tRNA lysidine(34) synthetase TilS [Rickettsiales bacterium]
MNPKFKSFMEALPSGKIAVALSGGADSMALLYWCRAFDLDITALTVDHGLRPESGAEAEFAKRAAESLGIPHHILKWDGEKPSSGVEEAARAARYGLMLDFCRKNSIGILMTAHHADDNIETFLMNLGRGSGLFGLAGIRQVSEMEGITVIRPLLEVRRAEILGWCAANGVEFADDPMNGDERFLRVRVRKNRGLLKDKLDIPDERILSAISALDRARAAMEQSIDDLMFRVKINEQRIEFTADFLFGLPEEIRLKFLSRALQEVGGEKYPPRLDGVRRALGELDRDTTLTLAHCAVRRLGNKMLVVPEGSRVSFSTKKETT